MYYICRIVLHPYILIICVMSLHNVIAMDAREELAHNIKKRPRLFITKIVANRCKDN